MNFDCFSNIHTLCQLDSTLSLLLLSHLNLQCMCLYFYSYAMEHTYRDTCWNLYWITCHNVWWSRTGAGSTVVGTRVRGSHARTEEDTGLVHLSKLCYTINTRTAAIAGWDASGRSLPGVGYCHWRVYPSAQLCDAGEVEASGGVDTSGGGAHDVHPWSRNWGRIKEGIIHFQVYFQMN